MTAARATRPAAPQGRRGPRDQDAWPRPNLPSQVARMISDEILAGRFQVGDRLPTERELAETFGVSRNVVREAVARLRFEGAVGPSGIWGVSP